VIRTSSAACIVGLAACTVACAPKARWDAKVARGYTPSGHTVSVFGVYKDGQLSSEAWSGLRPRFEPLLGQRGCDVALGDPLAGAALSAAIEDYARTNGPTEDLLAQLAPAAGGDLILVLVEAGSLPPEEKHSVVNTPAQGPSSTVTHGAAGLATYAPKKTRSGDGTDNVLQLSASLFSVAQGRSVASIDMQYSGDNVGEAESEFAARVGQLLPAATCKGWDWRTKVDPERIRKLAEE
jgi:hypothetical protein